jgi:hypothetical protein
MCTVIFIPQKSSCHFASLRDENPSRQQAIAPLLIHSNSNYIAPVDPAGGGTWAGVNENGNVVILLNGGFQNHTKKDSYAKSRGKIVAELLADTMPVVEWNLMNLDNIEPFTLIVWSEDNLFQLVWDGNQKHRINLSKTTAHIWSSATLYSVAAKNYRTELFNKWISLSVEITRLSLLNFFYSHNDQHNGFLMNRKEKIKTLSYTFITLSKDKSAVMQYQDFLSGAEHSSVIPLKTKPHHCLNC